MTRYAVYFAPEEGSAMHRFGWSWLGREPSRPEPLPPVPPEAAAWIAEPRVYGFHATLKPPFRLAAGCDRADLVAALRDFAGQRRAFVTAPPVLGELGGFLALRPGGDAAPLNELAAACVVAFDRFRAPPSDAELARRLAAPLSERQQEHLRRWGYPHVFEDFRFHLTLTGRLEPVARAAAAAVLDPLLRPAVEPLAVGSLCLFEQAPGQNFVLAERFPLRPA